MKLLKKISKFGIEWYDHDQNLSTIIQDYNYEYIIFYNKKNCESYVECFNNKGQYFAFYKEETWDEPKLIEMIEKYLKYKNFL